MIRESIKVLIVDDVLQVRLGLTTMLKLAAKNTSPQIEVIGEAQNGDEAISLSHLLYPDVVLMDLEMPVINGFEATRRIKADRSSIRVIILSIHAGMKEQELARAAGADGFVIKGSSVEVLVSAILSSNPPC